MEGRRETGKEEEEGPIFCGCVFLNVIFPRGGGAAEK